MDDSPESQRPLLVNRDAEKVEHDAPGAERGKDGLVELQSKEVQWQGYEQGEKFPPGG